MPVHHESESLTSHRTADSKPKVLVPRSAEIRQLADPLQQDLLDRRSMQWSRQAARKRYPQQMLKLSTVGMSSRFDYSRYILPLEPRDGRHIGFVPFTSQTICLHLSWSWDVLSNCSVHPWLVKDFHDATSRITTLVLMLLLSVIVIVPMGRSEWQYLGHYIVYIYYII